MTDNQIASKTISAEMFFELRHFEKLNLEARADLEKIWRIMSRALSLIHI